MTGQCHSPVSTMLASRTKLRTSRTDLQNWTSPAWKQERCRSKSAHRSLRRGICIRNNGSEHEAAALDMGEHLQTGIEQPTADLRATDLRETYAETQASDSAHSSEVHQLLPVMPLSKVKLPQETISLQLFEPRYRLLFKLVKQSKSRLFGLVLADQQVGMMESIGCLCELTHYIPVPARRRIVVVARAIGRFEIQHIYQDKPFMLANVQTLHDAQPQTFQQAATTSTAAMQLWQCMQQVSDLASKLYEHAGPLGDSVYSTEVQRWCPNRQAFASKQDTLPSGHANTLEMLVQAGLLSHDDMTDDMTEFLPRQRTEEPTEAQRHECFSFAVARTLEMTTEQLQHTLELTQTHERLQLLHDELADGRGYLAARNSLKGLL